MLKTATGLSLVGLLLRPSNAFPPPPPQRRVRHHCRRQQQASALTFRPSSPPPFPPIYQVENIGLLNNAKDLGFVGVNMYVDDEGSIKGATFNPRASEIATCCGKPMQVR